MKITVSPELNPDTGETVFAWNVHAANGEHVAGGYCATEADARSDARIALASLSKN